MNAAEVLKTAANLMRERAEAATPGPWTADVRPNGTAWVDVAADRHAWGMHGWAPTAVHVASWHPLVAVAVADWLDAAHAAWLSAEVSPSAKSVRAMSGTPNVPNSYALAVARAYLGTDAGGFDRTLTCACTAHQLDDVDDIVEDDHLAHGTNGCIARQEVGL